MKERGVGRADHRPPLGPRRLLGQGAGAALVLPSGTIDWWCPNRFDAPPVLWALLDPEGGVAQWAGAAAATWDGCPAGPTSRTVVRIDGRRIRLWDGLLQVEGGSMLVRLVRTEAGPARLTHRLRVGGFDGPADTWRGTPLRPSTGELHVVGADAVVERPDTLLIDVAAGADRWVGFAVTAVDLALLDPGDLDLERAMVAAEADDRRAMRRLQLPRRHPSRATDALRVLRALTDPATGAPVAAPTTSLPEAPGGQRQFDYRYSWLRDSGLAMATAALLGHPTAAERYLQFVDGLLRHDGDLRPLTTSTGDLVPPEREVHDVVGWAGSLPIRVGNDAGTQRQLDAVAIIVDAVWVHVTSGGAMRRSTWWLVDRLATRLAEAPFGETSGVWELRRPTRLVSDEIARWHGLDRAMMLRRTYRPWRRRPAWREARDAAHRRVEAVLDPVTGGLPQSFDGEPGETPDASALTAATSGFFSRTDPRAARLVHATISALEIGPFMRRYPPADDGFAGTEGAFVPASWWAVAALAVVGDLDEAQRRADEMCTHLPPLQPEEWDVEADQALGNTPLLWSHMEAARSLYVLDRERLRRRVGTVGVTIWGVLRYVRLRLRRR